MSWFCSFVVCGQWKNRQRIQSGRARKLVSMGIYILTTEQETQKRQKPPTVRRYKQPNSTTFLYEDAQLPLVVVVVVDDDERCLRNVETISSAPWDIVKRKLALTDLPVVFVTWLRLWWVWVLHVCRRNRRPDFTPSIDWGMSTSKIDYIAGPSTDGGKITLDVLDLSSLNGRSRPYDKVESATRHAILFSTGFVKRASRHWRVVSKGGVTGAYGHLRFESNGSDPKLSATLFRPPVTEETRDWTQRGFAVYIVTLTLGFT